MAKVRTKDIRSLVIREEEEKVRPADSDLAGQIVRASDDNVLYGLSFFLLSLFFFAMPTFSVL